jgi:hypothetical protein
VLSPTSPETVLEIPAGTRVFAVRLDVRELSNPQRQAFAIVVTLQVGSALDELGTAAPYPVGEPASIEFGLSQCASDGIAATGGMLTVTLVPVAVERRLSEPLSVQIGIGEEGGILIPGTTADWQSWTAAIHDGEGEGDCREPDDELKDGSTPRDGRVDLTRVDRNQDS